MEVSAVSSQGAPPRVVPVRPLPGEQPAKGFSWEDYEGVQVDEDASEEEEGGWGVVRSRRSQFISLYDVPKFVGTNDAHLQDPTRLRPKEEKEELRPRRNRSHSH